MPSYLPKSKTTNIVSSTDAKDGRQSYGLICAAVYNPLRWHLGRQSYGLICAAVYNPLRWHLGRQSFMQLCISHEDGIKLQVRLCY